jgi:hypothetical protein
VLALVHIIVATKKSAKVVLGSVADAGPVGCTFPIAQALCDDLCRLHGRLAQACVFDDLSLYTLTLVMQPFAQYLKFADEPVDFLDRAC